MKKIAEIFRPFWWPMLGVFGFIAVSQALGLVTPYLQGQIIDLLAAKSPDHERIYRLVGLMLLAFLGRNVVIMYSREVYEIKNTDSKISRHINRYTLSRLFNFSIGQHVSEGSGLKQSVINRGQHSLTSMVYALLYQVLPLCVEIVLLLGVLIYFSPAMALVVLTGTVVYTVFVVFINTRFKGRFRQGEKMNNDNDNFHREVLQNAKFVLANAQEHRAVDECDESLGKTQSFWQELWLRFMLFSAARNGIASLTRFCVLLLGVSYVLSGKYTVGEFVMIFSWASQIMGVVADMGGLHRQLIQMYTSVRKYFAMLEIEPDVKVLPNPVRPEKFAGLIEFRDVIFRYRNRQASVLLGDEDDDTKGLAGRSEFKEAALNGVSFVIEPGEKVAFVGESGAGKSTLVSALLRAQDPESGQITVDGHDLRNLDLQHFRRSIGIVDQQVSLFDQTLRYNMTYSLNGKGKDVSDEDLAQVGEMACLNRFFHRLEKGYETVIGERGVKLSGGECQRVGIARALIKQPSILIFDEATSNLDSVNEELIRESIERASEGRTTIIIAHRFSTIRNVDRVIVLDQGRVVSQGTHSELAASCPVYQRLVKNQQAN